MCKILSVILLATVAFVPVASARVVDDTVSLFECHAVKQTYASKAERRSNATDPDPVIRVLVGISEDSAGSHMSITHVTRTGRMFDRAEQYPVNTLKRTLNGFTWTGLYDRDPAISLTGTFRKDRWDWYYTETRMDHGRVAWSYVSRCFPVGGE